MSLPQEARKWERKVSEWRQLYSDPDAKFDKEIVFHAEDIDPMVTYGTNPGMGMSISKRYPLLRKRARGRPYFL